MVTYSIHDSCYTVFLQSIFQHDIIFIFQVDVHSVTCPGVWFPCKSPVYLSICFLGFHVKTKPFPAAFPLLFGDKFVFEKTFPGK